MNDFIFQPETSGEAPDFSEASPLPLAQPDPMRVDERGKLATALAGAAARARAAQPGPDPTFFHDVGRGYGGAVGGAVGDFLAPPNFRTGDPFREGMEAGAMFAGFGGGGLATAGKKVLHVGEVTKAYPTPMGDEGFTKQGVTPEGSSVYYDYNKQGKPEQAQVFTYGGESKTYKPDEIDFPAFQEVPAKPTLHTGPLVNPVHTPDGWSSIQGKTAEGGTVEYTYYDSKPYAVTIYGEEGGAKESYFDTNSPYAFPPAPIAPSPKQKLFHDTPQVVYSDSTAIIAQGKSPNGDIVEYHYDGSGKPSLGKLLDQDGKQVDTFYPNDIEFPNVHKLKPKAEPPIGEDTIFEVHGPNKEFYGKYYDENLAAEVAHKIGGKYGLEGSSIKYEGYSSKGEPQPKLTDPSLPTLHVGELKPFAEGWEGTDASGDNVIYTHDWDGKPQSVEIVNEDGTTVYSAPFEIIKDTYAFPETDPHTMKHGSLQSAFDPSKPLATYKDYDPSKNNLNITEQLVDTSANGGLSAKTKLADGSTLKIYYGKNGKPDLADEIGLDGEVKHIYHAADFNLPDYPGKLFVEDPNKQTLHVVGSEPKIFTGTEGNIVNMYETPSGETVSFVYDKHTHKPIEALGQGTFTKGDLGFTPDEVNFPPIVTSFKGPTNFATYKNYDPVKITAPLTTPLKMGPNYQGYFVAKAKLPDEGGHSVSIEFYYDGNEPVKAVKIDNAVAVEVLTPGQINFPERPDTLPSFKSVSPDDWTHYKGQIDAQHGLLLPEEEKAYEQYSNSAYHVNRKLWQPEEAEQRTKREERILLSNLSSGMDKARIRFNAITWAGVNESITDALQNMEVGDFFEHKGFLSSSLKQSTARDFAKSDWILRIHIPEGAQAMPMGSISSHGENEILLQRGVQLKKLGEDSDSKVIDVEPVEGVLGEERAAGGIAKPPVEPGKELSNYPMSGMREYREDEFPWEYREYTEYAKSYFPHAFSSLEDFKAQYDAAPLVHLPEDVIKDMNNATAGSYFNKGLRYAWSGFAAHRRVDRIVRQINEGQLPPPIALKYGDRYRILGGNTRMGVGAAMGYNLPMKVIDITGSLK